jgi:pyruvate ferredoxin oxidoreductase gamma subunit
VLILDPALAHYRRTDGLKEGGRMNATSAEALAPFSKAFRLTWVDGSAIAAAQDRHATAPIVNTTMVGAFARATGLVGQDDLEAAMVELFGAKARRTPRRPSRRSSPWPS